MWLQKKLNKRVIKLAIGSKYIYEIEAEEKAKWWCYYKDDDYEEKKSGKLKSFIKEWVNEMKKEISKKLDE